MKTNTRHDRILEVIAREGEARVDDLAGLCEVSVMTIRRDLDALEKAGRVSRTHGGAVLSRVGVVEFAQQEKGTRQRDEKRAIAREVVSRVQPGMAVTLDTGTTTLEVARRLVGIGGITVLTSSLAIASVLYPCDDIQLVLLGGVVGKRTPNMSGELTEENLKHFRAHLAVLGADAVTPDGAFTTEVAIARVSRAMVANADRVILAVDGSKFTETAFVQCMPLAEVDEVVTDPGCPAAARKWLAKAGVGVTFADPRKEQSHGR